jgi:hypothetical protein
MKKIKPAGSAFMVLMLVLAFAAWVLAGDLEPSMDPAPTMHSLEDIYNLIANVGPAPVAKTGQTSSYATGDDGDFEKGVARPVPRFTDNGNGTITDNLTGLIWLQDANRGGTMTWAEALTYCNSLEADGESLADGSVAGDWRLPNAKELLRLVDFGNYNPALPTGHPFTNVQTSYWSSTTAAYSDTDGHAWHVTYRYFGLLGAIGKLSDSGVWPVHSGH